jgi:hypothetical protein
VRACVRACVRVCVCVCASKGVDSRQGMVRGRGRRVECALACV